MSDNTVEAKISQGELHKETGNTFFREQKYSEALRCYHLALMYLKGLDNASLKLAIPKPKSELSESSTVRIQLQLISTYSNMAACYLKLNNPDRAISSCDSILLMDAMNAKATYRKAKAFRLLSEFDKSYNLLKSAAKLAPQDKIIRGELAEVQAEVRALDLKADLLLKANLNRKV